MQKWTTQRFMLTKRISFCFTLANFALLIHFAENLPPSTAVELTSVIALTSDMRPAGLAERNATLKEDGAVCVFNADCISGCCIYANSASGMCVAKATVGQICGFVYGADQSLDTHYRICQQCDTYCCCGTACCPTDYCAAALQLKPYVCTNCNTGCCCNTSNNVGLTACCPITYCVSTGGLKENNIKGKLCLRCQSGCCCGDTCCVSSFCKGNVVGQFDTSALNIARTLLAMYDMSAQQNAVGWPVSNSPSSSDIPNSNDGSSAAMFPVLAPAPLRVLGGGVMGTRIKAYLCIQCTTGCCCEVGCCNYIYCTVKH